MILAEERLKTTVEQWLKEIYPRDRAGDFTQALMELGAIVCVPKVPSLRGMPLAQALLCNAEGNWQEIPVKSGKNLGKLMRKRSSFYVMTMPLHFIVEIGKDFLRIFGSFPMRWDIGQSKK